MSAHWTQEQFALASEMLARGDDNAAFLAAFGKTKTAARSRRDRLKNGAAPRIYAKGAPRSGSATSERFVIPADVRADADRRAGIEPRSLTAAILRDPLPGMSAFDRKNSERRA